MKKTLLTIVLALTFVSTYSQTAEENIKTFLKTYRLPGSNRVRSASLRSLTIDDRKESMDITLGNGADEMFYTEETASQLKSDLRNCLPEEYSNYKLNIFADGRPLEYLIPTANKHGKPDKHKIWRKEYDGNPWVINNSRPYKISRGLDGRHLSICQSHGRYYDPKKGGWVWQRPRLFCTTEDLFSQTFVIPYIIPMLENAGAIVYSARDRFWQNNEEIVDLDTDEDIKYFEIALNEDEWEDSPIPGFHNSQSTYSGLESPFGRGNCRQIKSVKPSKRASEVALVQWVPDIPKSGRYPVYVSYQSFRNSAEDVVYEIHHAGGVSEVKVNQRMGGGTWVLLGEYEFLQGMNDNGKVVLSNICRKKGHIVSADAIRFGGGMGNIVRGGSVSGLPRWAEGAKYSSQWYGMSDSCFNHVVGDEYRSDIYSRPKSTNELGGGSIYIPSHNGRNVPIEACLAFHTDAGFSKTDKIFGPMVICTTDCDGGELPSGLDRYTSRDLASLLFEGLNRDLKKYNWEVRTLWNKNYGESRTPEVPSIILEMLSHQNFADMQMGYDPKFKFDFCRSVYKSILRYICSMHGTNYVVQPLPVQDFSISLDERNHKAVLNWLPTYDDMEPSAMPTSYIVYTRKGRYGFDNGQIVKGTSFTTELTPGINYSFKVCALNDGGKSFPSETLSTGISPSAKGTILIINGFTRLEGPASFNTETEQGFLLDKDPGIQYGAFAGFCGRQKVFSKKNMGSEATDGFGYSGNELEGKVIMGNTFDYPIIHGTALLSQGYSYTSMSETAFSQGVIDLNQFTAIDMIYGVQKEFNDVSLNRLVGFAQSGGRVILSGSNMLKNPNLNGRFGIQSAGSLSDHTVLSCTAGPFDIWRDMNNEIYSVPEPDILLPRNEYEILAEYTGHGTAGVRNGNVVMFGFPLESIKDEKIFSWLLDKSIQAGK